MTLSSTPLEHQSPKTHVAPGAAPDLLEGRDEVAPGGSMRELVRRHLLWGWVGLCFVLVMGSGLEILHAFKAPLYLDADSETRRLMWRLAHAHGGLVFLLHLGFAATLSALGSKATATTTVGAAAAGPAAAMAGPTAAAATGTAAAMAGPTAAAAAGTAAAMAGPTAAAAGGPAAAAAAESDATERSRGRASLLLRVGSIALPTGFFLGGIGAVGGDPSLGIVLVPVGALALLIASIQTAWGCRRSTSTHPALSEETP